MEATMKGLFYRLNGAEATGEAYAQLIQGMKWENPDFLEITRADSKSILVSPGPDGWNIEEGREDGSSWYTHNPMTPDDIKRIVADFLAGKDEWRAGLEWEMVADAPARFRRRLFWLLLVGITLIVVAFRLAR